MQDGASDVQPVLTVARQQQGTVQIDEVGALRHHHGRRHAERGGHHAADHDVQTRGPGFALHGQRFRQSAGLVELDVDALVQPRAPRQL